MIFTTYWFLAFGALALAGYWLVVWQPARLGFLAVACLVFHAHFAGPAGMAPIIVLMILTYAAGFSRRRAACVAVMIICALTLCFYKYALFLIGTAIAPWNAALAAKLGTSVTGIMPGAPPLGISFFTFEFVHYLFEVRRGGEPIRNPLKFLLFAIFFPSLVAGPIKRYAQFLPSLEEGSRRIQPVYFAHGLGRVALGFAKKVMIADNLTFYIDQMQPGFASLTLTGRWLVFAAIAFRILMDFSGYSDIAIGFARMLGVQLPENFNWPYLARNIQDFWQRWHISLSSWIRDYIYIPLGGSQHGPVRRIANGLIAFGLCGLWHGPAWHFVIWGIYHGVGLSICATYARIPGVGPKLKSMLQPEYSWAITQAFVWFGWLLFFYPTREGLAMARMLFGS